jgi:exopolysaccharide biosynthesis predicted pyruvyltransferase EpsI
MEAQRDRLLPLEAFAHVFEPLRGRRIGFVRPRGNVGDSLIEWGMRQLLEEFGVGWALFDPNANDPREFDELVFGGGGNMGTRYVDNWSLRGRLLELGLPVTILPQSFTSAEDRPYRRVYVRERASLAYCPTGILAPDLALGLRPPPVPAPTHRKGVFLRRDSERLPGISWFRRDPVRLCRTPQEYLALAARYERIVTDRLHFATCGLLAGREVTLIANNYHKNVSMYETWLRGLGCGFASDVRAALKQ